jgi:thiosulfate/3-mercaptopyruvate sulfurtransferase
VLDGGYRAWAGAGLPVSTDEPAPAPGDFTAEPGQMPVLDAAGAQETARTGLLLDARAGERYRGETEPVDPVAGHIPVR